MPEVGVIMGSRSDWEVMQDAAAVLKEAGVSYEVRIVSAHRTPQWMVRYALEAAQRGIQVIIAGAGGAAHLPGMVASITRLPVIGVPVRSKNSIQGIDSLLSIVQMPKGVPVATVAINNAANAALLAIRILALKQPAYQTFLENYYQKLQTKIFEQDQQIHQEHL